MMTINDKKDGTEKVKELGVYMHIPFCVRKCGYCDFLSFENESALLHKVYTKAVAEELKTRSVIYGNNITVNSIFIGGGTPSLILPSMIGEMIKAVRDNFSVTDDAEVTIEANPGTLSALKLESYLASGINRISIGAQSFNDFILKILGRVHIADDIYKSVSAAREAGFKNINLDLMFGIPEQTAEIWKDTLKKTLALSPDHISFYSLQIEKGTKFYELFETGPYEKMSDVLDREMYHFALSELRAAGYAHYEISNAAKRGFECRHNLKYWSMEEYIGAGLGAHSFACGRRTGNTADLEKYIDINLEHSGDRSYYELLHETNHENSLYDDMSEYMFTGLRLVSGIETADFERRFKRPLKAVYAKEWNAIESYAKDGFLIMEDGKIRLSEKGIDISNKIMSEFILQTE